MKKWIAIIGLMLLSGYVGATLTTTFSDLFALGNNGSGGPLFRIASDGSILTDGSITAGGNMTLTALSATGMVKGSYVVCSTTYSVTTATPSYVGQVVLGSDYKVYVGTQVVTCKWAMIGSQS